MESLMLRRLRNYLSELFDPKNIEGETEEEKKRRFVASLTSFASS